MVVIGEIIIIILILVIIIMKIIIGMFIVRRVKGTIEGGDKSMRMMIRV